MNRRAQPAITIRSQRAVNRLKLHTRSGRSQVEIVEEALDRLPLPKSEEGQKAELRKTIEEIQDSVARSGHRIPSMAEFDAREYDERGNCR